MGGFSSYSDFGGVDIDLGDIFDSFFGGGFQGFSGRGESKSRRSRGSDILKKLNYHLKKLSLVVKKTLNLILLKTVMNAMVKVVLVKKLVAPAMVQVP